MKVLLFILTLVVVSCGTPKSNESVDCIDSIDAISFKQIENTPDFWEYSKFILKYPESSYFNIALDKFHKARDRYHDSICPPVQDCFRNCAIVQIKTNQQIFYEYELIKKEDLQDSLLEFFCNENYQEYKPEKKYIEDAYGRAQEISKGYVQLQYIKDSCDLIQSVVIDIHQSLNSYKNYLSQNWYHKKFVELEDLEIHHLDSLLDNRLRLFGLDKEHVLPPPPPPPLMHEKYWPDSLTEDEMEELEKALNE